MEKACNKMRSEVHRSGEAQGLTDGTLEKDDTIRKRLKVQNITERCNQARLVKKRDQHLKRREDEKHQNRDGCVSSDMRAIGFTEDEVHDRSGWMRIVSAAKRRTCYCRFTDRLLYALISGPLWWVQYTLMLLPIHVKRRHSSHFLRY